MKLLLTKLIWPVAFLPEISNEWSLNIILNKSIFLDQISKEDLSFGDIVFISTKNSMYSVHVLDDNFYLVFGGWFDQNGLSPVKIQINGCTWGGSLIMPDIVAACGMRLEFNNGPVTSNIQKVMVQYNNEKN